MQISELLDNKPSNPPKEVIACHDSDTVSEAIARMAGNDIGAVVVCDDQGVAGIFTERDVMRGLDRYGVGFMEQDLGRVMVTKVIVVGPGSTVDEALELMNQNRIRHLPVVDKQTLIGVLSIRDVIVEKLKHVKSKAEFLQQQVQLGSRPLPM